MKRISLRSTSASFRMRRAPGRPFSSPTQAPSSPISHPLRPESPALLLALSPSAPLPGHSIRMHASSRGDVESAATALTTAPATSDGGPENRTPFGLEPWQWLLALATLSVAICYADRSNISTAIVPMADQYGWDKTFEGFVLSSFFLGYACTQMAGGALADKYGGKSVLLFGVTAWSFFTFITPQAAAGGAFTLISCRILMGLGEGVAFPSIHSLIARHVPLDKKTTAVGIATAASYAGTAAAFGLSPAVIENMGWPSCFYLFGASAALWLPFWYKMDVPPNLTLSKRLSDAGPATVAAGGAVGAGEGEGESARLLSGSSTAAESPAAANGATTNGNGAAAGTGERTLGERAKELWESDDVVALRALVLRREVQAICLTQYCQSWGMYGLLNWLPTFFKDSYGVEVKDLGGYTFLPYVVQGVLGAVTGVAADRLIAQGYPVRSVRVWLQTIGMLGPAGCLLLAVTPSVTQGDASTASLLITLGLALSSLTLGAVSASQLDIAPKHSGAVFGAGNTAATLAGFLAVPITGLLLDGTGSWSLVFGVTALHYVVGAVFWAMWCGDKPLPEDDIGYAITPPLVQLAEIRRGPHDA